MYLISKKIAEIVLSRKLSDQTANPMNDAEIQIAMNEEAISQWRDDNPKEYADIVEKVKEEYKGYSPIDPNQVTMLALKHAINFAVENGITKIQMNRPQFAGPSVYSLTYRQSKGLEENYTKKIPGLIKKLQNDLKFEISETPNGNIREYNIANIPTDEELFNHFTRVHEQFDEKLQKDPRNKKWIEYLLKNEFGFNDFEISQFDTKAAYGLYKIAQNQLDWVNNVITQLSDSTTSEELISAFGEDFKNTFGKEMTNAEAEELLSDPYTFVNRNVLKMMYSNNPNFITINLTDESKDIIASGMALFQQDQAGADRKSTRLNSSHSQQSRMPSSA